MNSRGNCVWLRSKLSRAELQSRRQSRSQSRRQSWRWCGLQSRRQSQQVQVDIFCATTVRVLGLVQYCAKWCKKAGEKRKAECEPGLDEVARYYPKALMSAGIAKYGIHLGQHQFNRCFAQNGSIRELAKEETSGFNTPRRDRLAHSSCLLVDVIPGQVCTDSLQRLQ